MGLILNHYLTLGLSVAALVAAFGCYWRVPVLGKELAMGLIAVAAGLYAYAQGYAARATLDETASLQARIMILKADLDAAHKAASDATARAVLIDQDRITTEQKVADYEQKLQSSHNQCALDSADLKWLRGISGNHK